MVLCPSPWTLRDRHELLALHSGALRTKMSNVKAWELYCEVVRKCLRDKVLQDSASIAGTAFSSAIFYSLVLFDRLFSLAL